MSSSAADRAAASGAVPPPVYPSVAPGGHRCPPLPPGFFDGPAALLRVLPNRRAGVSSEMGPIPRFRFPWRFIREADGMGTYEEENLARPSTTFGWKRVKIGSRPEGATAQSPKAASGFRRLSPRDKRDHITLTVTYRGGPECWYEIHARGSMGRFPGYVALEDLMATIRNDRRR